VRRIRAKAIDVPERMLDSRDHSIEAVESASSSSPVLASGNRSLRLREVICSAVRVISPTGARARLINT